MKRLLFYLLISTSLFAGPNDIGSFKVGLVSSDHSNDKLYFGADWMMPSSKFTLGLGFDFVGIQSGGSRETNANGNYTLGTQMKAGYNFNELVGFPVALKSGIGYGVTQYYKDNYYGWQYDIGLEAKLYKVLGAGVSYKRIDTNTEIGITDNYLFYFSIFI
jgi:hypothetical protein